MLQTQAGRSSDTPNVTSRDRIRQLEFSVGKLWSVLRDVKTELGHTNDQSVPESLPYEDEQNGLSDSDASEMSPINPPAHLQQLFDNELVDTQGGSITSPESSNSDKAASALLSRARARLQALVPPKEDVQAVAPLTQTWFVKQCGLLIWVIQRSICN